MVCPDNAGQSVIDVILSSNYFAGFPVYIRFIVPVPHYFENSIQRSGKTISCGQVPLVLIDLREKFQCLFLSPGIRPYRGSASEETPAFIQRHGPQAVSGNSKTLYVFTVLYCLFKEFPCAGSNRVPPVLRPLLMPSGLWVYGIIRYEYRCQTIAFQII